jgi:DNA invertase Pin-like site-specific DNA recombinase
MNATKTKRVALYLRVSTDGQTVTNQRRELEQAAQHHGWDVVGVYQDKGISGAKGRDKRPAFDKLLHSVTRRDVDMVAAWSVDRLGRSLVDLLGFLQELHAKDVGLYLHQQGIDTTTPAGKAMFSMMGVFAEFERSMIQERVRAGLKRARAEGKVLGRPKVSAKVEAKVRDLRRQGTGIQKTARLAGCGVGTVIRIDKETA